MKVVKCIYYIIYDLFHLILVNVLLSSTVFANAATFYSRRVNSTSGEEALISYFIHSDPSKFFTDLKNDSPSLDQRQILFFLMFAWWVVAKCQQGHGKLEEAILEAVDLILAIL